MLWLLAAVEDAEKVKVFSVISSLGFVCISSDFFEGRTEGCCVPMDSMRALERGQGKVGEILLGPPIGHMNKPTPTVSHASTSYRSGAGI